MAVITCVVLLSAVSILSAEEQRVSFEKCYTNPDLINGCSVPWGLNFPYKAMFTPACDYHDVCYSCGSGMEATREQCDQRFLQNMQFLCNYNQHGASSSTTNNNNNVRRRKRSLETSAWEKFFEAMKGSAIIGRDFWVWIRESTGSLDHCMTGAHVYFHAVRHFSMDYFHNTTVGECQFACAEIMGNPRLSIDNSATRMP